MVGCTDRRMIPIRKQQTRFSPHREDRVCEVTSFHSLSPVLIGCMRTMSPTSKLNLLIRNIIVVSCNHWKRCKTRSTDHVCSPCFRLQFLYFAIVHRFPSRFPVIPDVTNSTSNRHPSQNVCKIALCSSK